MGLVRAYLPLRNKAILESRLAENNTGGVSYEREISIVDNLRTMPNVPIGGGVLGMDRLHGVELIGVNP